MAESRAASQPPTYHQLVERYNRNIEPIHSIRASGTVVFSWHDHEGKHHVQANGELAIVLPDRLMFKVKHISRAKPIIWAGYDARRYWVFDFREDAKVYHGLHANFEHAKAAFDELPLHPLQLPTLLGLHPIGAPTGMASVQNKPSAHVIEPTGLNARLYLAKDSNHTKRVEILDSSRSTAVIARLTRPRRVKLKDTPPGAWPLLATRFEITRPGHAEQIEMTTPWRDLPSRYIKPAWFDLDLLIKLYRIPPQQQIDVDARRGDL